jgi:hypothetical protein
MNDPRNPYAPPTTQVADRDERPAPDESGQFIPYGRVRPPGRGAGWIGDAWRLLRARPGMWYGALIVWFVVYMVVSMIPLVNVFAQLLGPFGYAGIALAADQQRRTGTFELGTVFDGFKKAPVSLLAVGGVVLLAGVVFVAILAIFVGAEIFSMVMRQGTPDPSVFFSVRFLLAFLIGLALLLPVSFAAYLAPQLIVLHGLPALEAMKMSLAGCAKNILSGLVFSLCLLLLLVISAIPLLLGFLVSIPIIMLTSYTVYRDIFVEENP